MECEENIGGLVCWAVPEMCSAERTLNKLCLESGLVPSEEHVWRVFDHKRVLF